MYMRSIINFILEAKEKKRATVEWMHEKYAEFNKLFFNNECPSDIKLDVKPIKNNWLGEQGFDIEYYISKDYMKDDMYQMMYFPNDKLRGMKTIRRGKRYVWVPILDNATPVKSIVELKPFIHLSSRYLYGEMEMEDTLVHEMVHLWISKDGLDPKRAHGKEFKHKCKEIRELAKSKYGKDWQLTAISSQSDGYEIEDNEAMNKAIEQSSAVAGGVWSIYLIFSEDVMNTKTPYKRRFLFCSKNMLNRMLYYIKHNSDAKYLTTIYLSSTSYVPSCKAAGQFKLMRTYKFWDLDDYKNLEYFLEGNKVNVKDYETETAIKMSIKTLTNESVVESKIKIDDTSTIIHIAPETNKSVVNSEDIIDGVEDEIETWKKSNENDKKLIDIK